MSRSLYVWTYENRAEQKADGDNKRKGQDSSPLRTTAVRDGGVPRSRGPRITPIEAPIISVP